MSPLEGNRLLDRLEEGETVLALAKALVSGQKAGLFVVTNRRAFLIWATLRSAKIIRPITLTNITWVDVDEPQRSLAEVGDKVVRLRGPAVGERFVCFDGWQSVVAAITDVLAARDNTTTPAAGSGLASELERVAALWRSGALTDDEFSAAKATILRNG